MRRIVHVVLAFLSLAWLNIPAVAQGEESESAAKLGTRAVPIETRMRYPRAEKDRKHEGWVDVSFVITKDGSVIDPVIESSIGNRFFESATLRSVKKWKFEPATWNGEPVEQCETEYRVHYAMGLIKKPTKKFRAAYERASQAFVDGKLSVAEEELEKLSKVAIYNYFESSRYWYLKALLYRAKGDLHAAVDAFQHVGLWRDYGDVGGLDFAMYRVFFATLVANNDMGEALERYSVMRTLDGAVTEEIEKVVKGIVELGRSSQPFKVNRTIFSTESEDEVATIRYRPLRREFGLDVQKGSIDKLEIRCDRKRISDTVVDGKVWKMREDWGLCYLYVTGNVGSEFSVIELPGPLNFPESWL